MLRQRSVTTKAGNDYALAHSPTAANFSSVAPRHKGIQPKIQRLAVIYGEEVALVYSNRPSSPSMRQ